MPLFRRANEETSTSNTVPQQTYQEKPKQRSSLFGGRKDNNVNTAPTTTNHSSGGMFHRDHEDASIVDARQRVANAEAAERDADRALIQARAAVRDARAHVKRLENEAAEEARLAKIKQKQAANLGKRAKPLGRHDRV